MLISIVLPCYNEAKLLPEASRRLTALAQKLGKERFEFIYVDDGSRDETATLLHEMSLSDERVKALRLSRNFGHQVATTAGLEHASGDAVVIMDADLQDPPEVIVQMYARWLEGYHVAYGQREERVGETRFKLWSAKTFYRLVNRLSPVAIPNDTGDFRLMDRAVVEALLRMPERDRFLRGMVSWVGFRQVAVPYRREARFAGESKFPLSRWCDSRRTRSFRSRSRRCGWRCGPVSSFSGSRFSGSFMRWPCASFSIPRIGSEAGLPFSSPCFLWAACN